MSLSKSSIFNVFYIFIGAIIINTLFLYNSTKELHYQNELISDEISQIIMYYVQDRQSVDVNTIKNIVSKIESRFSEHNVILLSDSEELLYTDISDMTRVNNIRKLLSNILDNTIQKISFVRNGYIYHIEKIPPTPYNFKKYGVSIKLNSTNELKTFILISIIPLSKVFENPILILINLYFLLYILYLIYCEISKNRYIC